MPCPNLRLPRPACRLLALGCLFVGGLSAARGEDALRPISSAIQQLERLVPNEPSGFAALAPDKLRPAVSEIERRCGELVFAWDRQSPKVILAQLDAILQAKKLVDDRLARLLEQRTHLNQLPELNKPGVSRGAVRGYLACCSQWIQLSGRLRYLQFDAIQAAVADLEGNPKNLPALISLLKKHQSSIGAAAVVDYLFENEFPNHSKISQDLKRQILELIALTHQVDLMEDLAELVVAEETPAPLVVIAAQVIHQIGIPQEPRGDEEDGIPAPAITPLELLERLKTIDPATLPKDLVHVLDELKEHLARRHVHGLEDATYRLGALELRDGDWLLMKNPSPYNLFTDLSPGLFTHVGLITSEVGEDGRRRMVVVDMPERGRQIPATNVEIYVQRTLHYLVLRDPDPEAAKLMADTARSLIGNESEFDLNFQTSRVARYQHQALKGEKIKTYCAGLLLLCSQETPFERGAYFPIVEFPAAGRTSQNLATLGLSLGEDFVSPTGALFSSRLRIVGGREPMYEPRREIEEAIYDHFANSMVKHELVPSQSVLQFLRLKLAEQAKSNEGLAQALARAAEVGDGVDLVAAAKTAAVVETLDEIAQGSSLAFNSARAALRTRDDAKGEPVLQDPMLQAAARKEQSLYRQRHARLLAQFNNGEISPRTLRQSLVRYYVQDGCRQIDERFFNHPVSKPNATNKSTTKAKR